jgi:hypothetical protein
LLTLGRLTVAVAAAVALLAGAAASLPDVADTQQSVQPICLNTVEPKHRSRPRWRLLS